jgi:hypothetical protein
MPRLQKAENNRGVQRRIVVVGGVAGGIPLNFHMISTRDFKAKWRVVEHL